MMQSSRFKFRRFLNNFEMRKFLATASMFFSDHKPLKSLKDVKGTQWNRKYCQLRISITKMHLEFKWKKTQTNLFWLKTCSFFWFTRIEILDVINIWSNKTMLQGRFITLGISVTWTERGRRRQIQTILGKLQDILEKYKLLQAHWSGNFFSISIKTLCEKCRGRP